MDSENTPTTRTTQGLRETLFLELDAIRSGKSNAARANAVGRLAAQIINVTQLEMSYYRFIHGAKDTASSANHMAQLAPIQLGEKDLQEAA